MAYNVYTVWRNNRKHLLDKKGGRTRRRRNKTVWTFAWNFCKASYNIIEQKSCFYGLLSSYIFSFFCFVINIPSAYSYAFTPSLCRRSGSDINISPSLYLLYSTCTVRFRNFSWRIDDETVTAVVQIHQFPNGSRLEDNKNFIPIDIVLESS